MPDLRANGQLLQQAPMPATQHERRTIRFAGEVQGVGFRYTTRQIAASHPVTGHVSNQRSGEVLLVVEGASTHLDAMLRDLRRHFAENIQSETEQTDPATGEFTGFTIRHF